MVRQNLIPRYWNQPWEDFLYLPHCLRQTWMSVVGFPSLLLNKRAKINSVFPLLSLLSANLTCLDFVAFVWLAAAN